MKFFSEKTKLQNIMLGISPSSTLMKYLKDISNWPDPEGQMMDMSQIIHIGCIMVIFLEKLKTIEAHEYA